MWTLKLTCLVLLFAAGLWPADQDIVTRGRDLVNKRCSGCHGVDNAKVGPALRGIYGRRAAADSAFPYSDGLKKSKVVWDEATLDRWLADPESLVPENDMSFRLNQESERAAIIAYLKQLSSKQAQH